MFSQFYLRGKTYHLITSALVDMTNLLLKLCLKLCNKFFFNRKSYYVIVPVS